MTRSCICGAGVQELATIYPVWLKTFTFSLKCYTFSSKSCFVSVRILIMPRTLVYTMLLSSCSQTSQITVTKPRTYTTLVLYHVRYEQNYFTICKKKNWNVIAYGIIFLWHYIGHTKVSILLSSWLIPITEFKKFTHLLYLLYVAISYKILIG